MSLRGYGSLLGKYLRPQALKVLGLALLLFGSTALQLINPQIVRYFIDTALAAGPSSLLITAACIFIGFVLLTQLTSSLANYVGENVGITATNFLRLDLMQHCLNLDQSFFKDHTPGEMVERIEGDVGTLTNFLSKLSISLLGDLMLLIGILVLISVEDWRLGLIAIAFTVIGALVLRRTQGVSVPHARRFRQSAAELSSFTEEQLLGIEDTAANGGQSYAMRRFYSLYRQYLGHYRMTRVMARMFTGSMEIGLSLAAAVVLGTGALLFRQGTLSIGTLYLVFYYLQLLSFNLQSLVMQFSDIQIASASVERVNELLSTNSQLSCTGGAMAPHGDIAVAFQDVSFNYEPGQPILCDISFALEAGKSLGLLGRTGSGKTTITRLLFRLYDPTAGQITFNGIDIRTIELDQLRKSIGLVTQDVHLFHGTVRDNITLFDRTVDDKTLIQALNQVGLTAWYTTLPAGLDTPITPQSLSAGQAQLLAFTRVFLQDPKIIIFDEASSRLDPFSEQLLDKAARTILHSRTCIIIAHRLETLEKVDRIVILDQGRIIEQGRRQDLAANPHSYFASLIRTGLSNSLDANLEASLEAASSRSKA